MSQQRHRSLSRPGFTIMEMLAVVAIILVLVGLGGYYYLKQAEQAKKSAAYAQVKTTLTQAVESYYLQHDSQWPPSLEALLQADDRGGPYLTSEAALLDPWGNPYRYDPSGTNNQGRQPDIWAETPNGPVGNWMRM